jgi:hypothetical protein
MKPINPEPTSLDIAPVASNFTIAVKWSNLLNHRLSLIVGQSI